MIDPTAKMKKDTRVLVLEKIEGKDTKTNTGLVDNRLFSGENNLRAIKHPGTNIWEMRYDSGGLPEPLKQKFTSFNKLVTHASRYFDKRGIKISKVID
jgi:hypothetical protein